MKEVTYEDWVKNPTPRMMLVWDDSEKDKIQRKVVYVIKSGVFEYPVLTTRDNDEDYEVYNHCAEIEKLRRMTNKELSRWLRENPTREWKYRSDSQIQISHTYSEYNKDREIADNILIREDDGEWREPLVEVEE